ncbi:chromate resistance protein ChrB domain-containing protein [Stutzerimonas stutzeri]|uniref:chromate resistance protein ChrB domain-containing protein n=1 Tax=Stutzerimonas stutzeri TaxID=316 RepID=UPI00300ECDAD
MVHWLCLILALPTSNAAERMRAWRALKAAGAAVLRDGVYLLPDQPACRESMSRVERDILGGEGYACVLPVCDPQGERFVSLFSRASEYDSLRAEADAQLIQVTPKTALSLTRQARKLRKAYAQLTEIDFFPDAAQQQADARLRELELAISRALSRDEPSSQEQALERLSLHEFKGRTWATRCRPWVDRLASAWLIRRFIDPAARILWLPTPEACPSEALGFDFDGARFSHVGDRVTFETIQASFSLAAPGLDRVAAVVHYLDIGGTQPAEAAGVERVLAGLRASLESDDELLDAACAIFDGLLAAFAVETQTDE